MIKTDLETTLCETLIRDWGYVVGSAGLRQALGYPSQAALRQAISRGAVPVKVFEIEGRKGPFALAHELAAWLATHGTPKPNPNEAAEEESPASVIPARRRKEKARGCNRGRGA